jgi:hypothetical protein
MVRPFFGIGAASGHHEHRSPSTRVATEARGWRSTFRRSIARPVPQPGQNTSSQGVPAISAARIVGDHSMSRLAASCSFQRPMTAWASARAAASATCRLAAVAMSRPRVRTPIAASSVELQNNPRPRLSYHRPARARLIAGLSGFLTLIQSREGPER